MFWWGTSKMTLSKVYALLFSSAYCIFSLALIHSEGQIKSVGFLSSSQ